MKTLRIATRTSTLAMFQTNLVADQLRAAHPGVDVQIVGMSTKGDRVTNVPLPEVGGKGLFTKELEDALLAQTVDLAVHSLKDLPSDMPDGLELVACPRRADPTDAFISSRYDSIEQVPAGATIATGSVRRRAQLMTMIDGVNFVDLRGNIETRLRKLDEHGWAGIIMATAALERLEMSDRITQRLLPPDFIPAVGQGAIAIEVKSGRADVARMLAPLEDPVTQQAVLAERHFMSNLEGGCSVPLAAFARPQGDQWEFWSFVSDVEATQVLRTHDTGPDPMALARGALEQVLAQGAAQILGH